MDDGATARAGTPPPTPPAHSRCGSPTGSTPGKAPRHEPSSPQLLRHPLLGLEPSPPSRHTSSHSRRSTNQSTQARAQLAAASAPSPARFGALPTLPPHLLPQLTLHKPKHRGKLSSPQLLHQPLLVLQAVADLCVLLFEGFHSLGQLLLCSSGGCRSGWHQRAISLELYCTVYLLNLRVLLVEGLHRLRHLLLWWQGGRG